MSAWIVVEPGTNGARTAPIESRLLVGRECEGAEPSRRLIIDDPTVSREHLEVRVSEQRNASLVDLSKNGTRLNGRRVERGEPIPIIDGDLIEIGEVQLLFRDLRREAGEDPRDTDPKDLTMVLTPSAELAIVVGDIVGYTAMTERDGAAVAAATETLFGALRELLVSHRGTVSNYVGDAIFTAWEVEHDPDGVAAAVAFAADAEALTASLGEALELRSADGDPLRLGWAITHGQATISRPSAGQAAALGDAVNLAFRLAGLAARHDRPGILATAEVAALAPDVASYGEPFELFIKGRSGTATVRAVSARDESQAEV